MREGDACIDDLHLDIDQTIRSTLDQMCLQRELSSVDSSGGTSPSSYSSCASSVGVSCCERVRMARRSCRSLFVPRDVDEEILLLLLLGQSSALNEAVLDWQPEYEAQRERSHQSAYHLLSLLAIFLSRKQAFHLIADVRQAHSPSFSNRLSLVVRTSPSLLLRTLPNLVQLRPCVDLLRPILPRLSRPQRMPSNATSQRSSVSTIGEDHSRVHLSREKCPSLLTVHSNSSLSVAITLRDVSIERTRCAAHSQ